MSSPPQTHAVDQRGPRSLHSPFTALRGFSRGNDASPSLSDIPSSARRVCVPKYYSILWKRPRAAGRCGVIRRSSGMQQVAGHETCLLPASRRTQSSHCVYSQMSADLVRECTPSLLPNRVPLFARAARPASFSTYVRRQRTTAAPSKCPELRQTGSEKGAECLERACDATFGIIIVEAVVALMSSRWEAWIGLDERESDLGAARPPSPEFA